MGQGKWQILVINRARVLGSGPHTPIHFFWEYPPPPPSGSSYPRDIYFVPTLLSIPHFSDKEFFTKIFQHKQSDLLLPNVALKKIN